MVRTLLRKYESGLRAQVPQERGGEEGRREDGILSLEVLSKHGTQTTRSTDGDSAWYSIQVCGRCVYVEREGEYVYY